MQFSRRILAPARSSVCTRTYRHEPPAALRLRQMLPPAGPVLDKEIARRLGEDRTPVAGYSTDHAVADRLISRLEESAIIVTWVQAKPFWYCTLAVSVSGARERIATGTAETRPLALCRAVVNLPDGRRLSGGKKPASK